MNYSTNYEMNLPERNEQFNIDHWNNNTEKIDTTMHTNEVNIATNATNIAILTQALTEKNVSDTSSIYYKFMKLCHPVGSLYWSSDSTNPSQLFGGTWTQIKDKFVLACGDSYNTVNAIGGNSNVTLTNDNLPSHTHTIAHTHSFTPSGTVSAHTHTIAHTHKVTASGSVSVTTNPTFTGSSATSSSAGAHTHTVSIKAWTDSHYSSPQDVASGGYDAVKATRTWTTSSAGAHTHTVTAKGSISGGAYKFTGSAVTSGASSAENSGSTTPTFTGTEGTTAASSNANSGSVGSGKAFSVMPPYVVKYCWERTA